MFARDFLTFVFGFIIIFSKVSRHASVDIKISNYLVDLAFDSDATYIGGNVTIYYTFNSNYRYPSVSIKCLNLIPKRVTIVKKTNGYNYVSDCTLRGSCTGIWDSCHSHYDYGDYAMKVEFNRMSSNNGLMKNVSVTERKW